MTQADERVLEFLLAKDIIASPGVIGANIEYTGEYISRRCQKLADAGLVQRADASNYRITEKGIQFLDGTLDVSELEIDDNK